MAQLGARLDGIEEVVGSNPIGSTNFDFSFPTSYNKFQGTVRVGPFGGDPRLRLAILLAVVPWLVPTRASGVLLILAKLTYK